MTLLEIESLVEGAHLGQFYGALSYFEGHILPVVKILKDYGYDDLDTLAGAYLHDVLEDTLTTEFNLMNAGISVDALAIAVFCKDIPGPNRKTRKALTYAHMKFVVHASFATDLTRKAMRVKLADRIANLRACKVSGDSLLKMYQKESVAFKDALYMPGWADAMWIEYDKLIGVPNE